MSLQTGLGITGDRASTSPTDGRIILSDNLPVLQAMLAESVGLIYVDPPFNTGKIQSRTRIRVTQDEDGDRTGFKGTRYRTEVVGRSGYNDRYDDYMDFLLPRLREAYRILEPTGSFFLHIDYREAHYCKVLLDEIFGRASFMNEIIWAYDYGARSKRKWSAKHDTIFWYAKDPNAYTFNFDVMDRIPYMAPGLVGKEKAARGKTPTDVWWHTIVSPNGREKTGYPTQKPLGILERIVKVHSNPGDTILDFFAGSGTGQTQSRIQGSAEARIQGRHSTCRSQTTPSTGPIRPSRATLRLPWGVERRAKPQHAMAGTTYWLTRIRRRRASWPRAWPTTMWRPSGSTGSTRKCFNEVCLSNMR